MNSRDEFTIATAAGPRNVIGSVQRGLGIHRDPVTEQWVITHISTGLKLADLDTRRAAGKCVSELLAAGDWAFVATRAPRDLCEKAIIIFKRHNAFRSNAQPDVALRRKVVEQVSGVAVL